ncbi:Ring-type e3 ubiquitin transferase [Thalictrum thalictroides]|nr:Ring-type e3 ubiquitin transferase [Thalictrum thalictroides]
MESGGVSSVLNTCVVSDNTTLKELGLTLLLNLSLDNDDNKVGLVAEGAIGRVVGALRGGNSNCRAYAATLLTSLAMVEVNKGSIGAYPSAITTLVSLLRDGKRREKREAATALYVLCSFPDNKKRVVECGAVPILVEMVGLGFERAVEVLELLAKFKEGREEIGRIDGFVAVFVEVLQSGSSRCVVHALSALASLCSYSEELGWEVMRQGGLEICLRLVEDENEKTCRKAATLMQTLRKCQLKFKILN